MLRILIGDMERLGAVVSGVDEVGEGHHQATQLRHRERLIHFVDKIAFKSSISPPDKTRAR
jgi:hypothetical protein